MPASRILVLANETIAGRALYDELVSQASEGAQVEVIAPALSPRLKFMMSDVDGGIKDAEGRLQATLSALNGAGVQANGRVGDSDPLRAYRDGVSVFNPDLVVISTHPKGKSNWLEKGLVEKVRDESDVEVRHVVVDLEKEGSQTASGTSSSG